MCKFHQYSDFRFLFLKRMFFVFALLALLATASRGSAENMDTSSTLPIINVEHKSSLALAVLPGPLEKERAKFLAQIQTAKKRGIGIQNYLTAFLDIENMINQGTSEETVKKRLDSVSRGIVEQLELTKQPLPKPLQMKTSASLFPTTQNKREMSLERTKVYMLSLVNGERVKHHLPPLMMDTQASQAAQIHADEMASIGYSAHWDILGRKPDQRYTECGGKHSVSENLAYTRSFNSSDKAPGSNSLERAPTFLPSELECLHSYFMDEKPPNDLHRKQLLAPEHNRLGVGLSHSINERGEEYLCLDQEFVDEYGEYSVLPKKIVPTHSFDWSGSFVPGIKFYSASVRWEPAPIALSKEQLNAMPHSYVIPDSCVASYSLEDKSNPRVKYWIKNNREHFSIRITPDMSWKPGLYYFLVWAKRPIDKQPILTSNRTIVLD